MDELNGYSLKDGESVVNERPDPVEQTAVLEEEGDIRQILIFASSL